MPPGKTEALATQDKSEKTRAGNGLIEFSSVAQEDPNDGIVFGDAPVHCACPHCDRSVITFVDYETSWVTWVLGLAVWISLGWMAFWVLPLLWPAFKDAVHHCPRCLNVIARKARISLPTFKSEVMSFKVGSCAVVLARKYVIIALLLVSAVMGSYFLKSTMHLTAPDGMPKGPESHLTWPDFLTDCGPRTGLRKHAMSASRAFEEKYRTRTFTWQGEVIQIREGYEFFMMKTKSIVLVKMYPQRYAFRESADVALLFGEEVNNEVADLNQGDWIEFEATMLNHGMRGDPEVMLLWHVKAVPRPAGPMGAQSSHSMFSGPKEPEIRSKYSAEAAAEDREKALPLAVDEAELKRIGALLTGDFIDPNHVEGFRALSVEGAVVTIQGSDRRPKEQGAEWTLYGRLERDFITIDFSPRGGPKELVAKVEGEALAFPDGNRWTKILQSTEGRPKEDTEVKAEGEQKPAEVSEPGKEAGAVAPEVTADGTNPEGEAQATPAEVAADA